MKKVILPTLAIVLIGITLLQGCHKEACPGGDPLPENPVLWAVTTSGCNTYTDALAAKDMNTDSIVVSLSLDNGMMSVTHYNMVLDCGSGDNIATTIQTYPATSHSSQEEVGDTIIVTENVGEQGRTNCICLYDHSFEIHNLPQRPFTLVIKEECYYLGNIQQRIVYQHTF